MNPSASGLDISACVNAQILARQNVSPKRLSEPGPHAGQLQTILEAAAAAPDHGQVLPWRFVIVPKAQRGLLAAAFGQALVDRDPGATAEQIDNAQGKAHRAPFLMLGIVRLNDANGPSANAHIRGAQHPESTEAQVSDAERLVSFGCAIQNVLLSAQAAGFGAGLTSGQAMGSARLRVLFELADNEQAVCCINIGTVSTSKPPRVRPDIATFVTSLT